MAEGIELFRVVGRLFLDGIQKFNQDLSDIDRKVGAWGKKMSSVGMSLTKYITLPLLAIGAGLLKIGNDFDEAYDKIRVGTGKTGDELIGLQDDFKAVAKVAPLSFDNISTAITKFNQKLGLVGKPLQNLSIQVLNLSRITKTDLNANIENSAKLFNNWKIATENQSKTLDLLFRASQKTGISIDVLMGSVAESGAIFRSMGYDLETSIAMVAQFDKEGVSLGTTLASMKKSLITMAKEGFTDPQEVLSMYIDRIKGAGTSIEATGIAAELFGARGGAIMAAAIREGRLNFDDLINSMKNGSDTIMKASDDTMCLAEQLTLLRSKISLAFEPLAIKVFESAIKIVIGITPKIENLAKWFGNLSSETQDSLIKWALMAIVIPPIISLLGRVATGVIAFKNALVTMNLGIASFAASGSIMAIMLTGLASGLSQFGAQGISALGLFIDQTGLLKSAVGELGHSVNIMKGELQLDRLKLTWGQDAADLEKYTRDMKLEIIDLLNVISKLSPEAQAKAMALFTAYREGTIDVADLNFELKVLAYEYDANRMSIDKAKQSVDAYKQSLIDKGVTVEKATEDAKVYAESMGYVADEEGNLEEATEDTTEAIDDQTQSVDELRSSFDSLMNTLFDGINANNELQEAQWAQMAAQAEVNKLIKEGKQETLEYEQAMNNLEAADQKVITSQYKVYTSIYTTKEEQEAARLKALEYGLQMVDSGEWGEEAFAQLAEKFGLSSADISKYAAIISSDLDEATKQREIKILLNTSDIAPKVFEAQRVLDSLKDKEVIIYTKYKYESYEEKYGLSSGEIPRGQEGAEIIRRGSIIVGEKGPEILNLPRGAQIVPLEKAGIIVTNYFNIDELVVRERADIKTIADQLLDSQEKGLRGIGEKF